MIGYREWRIFWDPKEEHPLLVSLYFNRIWKESTYRGQTPEEEIELGHYSYQHGAHAYTKDYVPPHINSLSRPGVQHYAGSELRALGSVYLGGKIVEHSDNVVRASFAQILSLRVACDCDRVHYLAYLNDDIVQGMFRGQLSEELFPNRPHGSTVEELQRQLLLYYEVPELPMGDGPWYKPWGWNEPPRLLLG